MLIGFRVAYAVGQTLAGRVIDVLGTRRGLSLSVAWYSCAAMATSLATGLASFVGLRFALGLGEAGNWPGATKAVSEWFPRRESGWAVALFDSGSSIGGALAPFIVLTIYHWFGSWRPAFLITGSLGFLWLFVFRACTSGRRSIPWISDDERTLIISGREEQAPPHSAPASPAPAPGGVSVPGPALGSPSAAPASYQLPYRVLLRLPQTWGYILSKTFTDPVWFFITDWFAIYLVSRGFKLEESLVGFWVPFLAADLGNFFGGGFSSWLITRGWSVGAARKCIAVIGGLGMTLLVPVGVDVIVLGDGRLLRDVDVRLRRVLHDHPQPARRHLPDRLGRERQRDGRHRRGHRHHRRDLPDRLGRRPLLVRPDPDRREHRAAGRDGGGAAAGAEHGRDRAGDGQADLIRSHTFLDRPRG